MRRRADVLTGSPAAAKTSVTILGRVGVRTGAATAQPGMEPQAEPGMEPQAEPGMEPQAEPGMQLQAGIALGAATRRLRAVEAGVRSSAVARVAGTPARRRGVAPPGSGLVRAVRIRALMGERVPVSEAIPGLLARRPRSVSAW